MCFAILLVLLSSAFATNLQDMLLKTDIFFEVPKSPAEVQRFENSLYLESVRRKRQVMGESKEGKFVSKKIKYNIK